MRVTIPTKDVGPVRDRRCCGEAVWTLEDGIEEWIKRDMGVGV